MSNHQPASATTRAAASTSATIASVRALWRKTARRGPMAPTDRVELVAGHGIVGNANQGGRRQVTVIAEEAWGDALADLGTPVDPIARRANVLVRGLDLANTRGRILQLGSTRLRILGETRPCPRMDEAAQGLQAALVSEWRGGAYGEVLDDGVIVIGDAVAWDDGPEQA